MNSFKVLLDTATLLPPLLRDFILTCAEADFYKAYWSDDILIELKRHLIADLKASERGADGLIAQMKNAKAFENSLIPRSDYIQLIANMTNDPKDYHVLAAAVAVGAELIVTPNIKDFPKQALEPYGIAVFTPDEFLLELFDRDPGKINRVINYYSYNRRSQKPVKQILDQLNKQVPRFVEAVQNHILGVDKLFLGE